VGLCLCVFVGVWMCVDVCRVSCVVCFLGC